MAIEDDLKALQVSGKTVHLRDGESGEVFVGRIIGPDTSVVSDSHGNPVQLWVIQEEHGRPRTFEPEAVKVLKGMELVRYRIETELLPRGVDGAAFEAVKQSFINELVADGKFSETRAEQVVEEELERARQSRK